MSDVLRGSIHEIIGSPIVWPNSSSKKKYRTRKLKENRERSKLSLKYNSSDKEITSQKKQVVQSKRRSSVDVFECVYKECLQDDVVVPETPSPSVAVAGDRSKEMITPGSFQLSSSVKVHAKSCNRVLSYGGESTFSTHADNSWRHQIDSSTSGSNLEVIEVSDSAPEDDSEMDRVNHGKDETKYKTKDWPMSTEVSRTESWIQSIDMRLAAVTKRKTVRISKQFPQVFLSSSDDEIPLPLSERVPMGKKFQPPVEKNAIPANSEKINELTAKKERTTMRKPYIILSDSDSDESFPNRVSNDKGLANVQKCLFPITKSKKPRVPTTVPRAKPLQKHRVLTSHISPSSVVLEGPEANAFLDSLEPVCIKRHLLAEAYCSNFKKKKDELVATLYSMFNKSIFENKLPADMQITWNPRLTKTAGYCYYRRQTSAPDGRSARLELSSKVLDCADRVRDTVIHEMCHAASWIIYGYRDGHGPLWQYWARKANTIFPSLPVISRCHSYVITTKFTYKCQGCGGCIGRHSKSVDIMRKVCSRCGGKFKLLIHGRAASEITPKSTPFAQFVKENYGKVKSVNKGLKHVDVMKALSAEFAAKAVLAS